uniref:GUCT domain-containing protein n=2 Tax=Physcomitrium patens TaxID=3218 RepID=A0A7I4EZ41_PHYPA
MLQGFLETFSVLVGTDIAAKELDVNDVHLVPLFCQVGKDFVESNGLSILDIFAKAITKISNQIELKKRSLVTFHDYSTTIILKANTSMYSSIYAFNYLQNFLPKIIIDEVRYMNFIIDRKGEVFDILSKNIDEFIAKQTGKNFIVKVLDTLYEL